VVLCSAGPRLKVQFGCERCFVVHGSDRFDAGMVARGDGRDRPRGGNGDGGAVRREAIADLASLRVNRPWRRNWLKAYQRDLSQGAHFVVLLSRDCPYCKRWAPLLNVIEVRPELPSVVGVMSLEGEQLEGFLGEHLIRFPIAHMPQSLVSLMVSAYPTAALVEDGRIRRKWVGEMPKEYLEKVRQFFEVVAPPRKGASTFGG
jgi:hypothetical protein